MYGTVSPRRPSALPMSIHILAGSGARPWRKSASVAPPRNHRLGDIAITRPKRSGRSSCARTAVSPPYE